MDKLPQLLIVEDDETNRFIVLKNLKDKFDCDFAIDGEEVLRKIETKIYDLILMDINLGNDRLNGEILMKIIKTNNHKVNTKVIAVTSYAMDGDKEYFLQAGFDMYLPKPLLKNELIDAINRALHGSESH